MSGDDEIWSTEPAAERSGPRRPGRQGPAGREGRPVPQRRPVDDGEYFDLPPESKVPRWVAVLLVVGLFVVVVFGGGWWWYQGKVNPPGNPGDTVEVVIPLGTSTRGVASILDGQGVISSSTVFNFYVGGKDLTAVQAGSYKFRTNSSFDDAIVVLNAGPYKPLGKDVEKVTVAEGLTVPEIVATISKQMPRFTVAEMTGLLDDGVVPSPYISADQQSYEGLLFPATYEVSADETALSLLSAMAAETQSRATALGIDAAPAALKAAYGIDVSAYDVLTVASLVQEEAGNPQEAPKVATVIYNRLEAGWALGIDATSRYLAQIEGGGVDFSSSSPYNTRINRGVPPTPIASAGEYALRAAIEPADGPWMYYVLTDIGVHTFVVTDAEFGRAKQICIEKDLGCG